MCVGSVFGPCIVIQYFVLSRWGGGGGGGEMRDGCFAFVFLMSCDSQCSVALPGGAVGWSDVCDCGTIS